MSDSKQVTPSERATYHHGDLRQTLINASVQLVLETGTEKFTLKDASRIAGVSVAAPYRHFSDKDEVLYEVAEESFRMMSVAMAKALEGKEPGTVESIIAQGQTYVQFAEKHPNLFRLMFREHRKRPDLNLPELLIRSSAKNEKLSTLELMSIDSEDAGEMFIPQELASQGVKCFSILLKNVAVFLRKHNIPLSETLGIASHLWAMVHGTASLLIDRNFQHFIPTVSTDEVVAGATQIYFTGLLDKQGNIETPTS